MWIVMDHGGSLACSGGFAYPLTLRVGSVELVTFQSLKDWGASLFFTSMPTSIEHALNCLHDR